MPAEGSLLAAFIKKLPGESKVVMEATGTYHASLARYLHSNGIFVSIVSAILIHDYSGNTPRKVKTDKKDALKISSLQLTFSGIYLIIEIELPKGGMPYGTAKDGVKHPVA